VDEAVSYRPDPPGYFISSAAELIGEDPAAAPKLQRDILSLWALVNLQLDAWRDGTAGPIPTKLIAWLAALSQADLISGFDKQAAPEKLGDGFRQRVDVADYRLSSMAAASLGPSRRCGSERGDRSEPVPGLIAGHTAKSRLEVKLLRHERLPIT
jgi:hypothetical protein